MVESHESMRQRTQCLQSKIHEDRIVGKGFTSMTCYRSVHKFLSMPKAMKNSDSKVAVDKEWKKLETIPAWNSGKKEQEGGYSSGEKRKQECPLCVDSTPNHRAHLCSTVCSQRALHKTFTTRARGSGSSRQGSRVAVSSLCA